MHIMRYFAVISALVCVVFLPANGRAQSAVPPPVEQTTADCARPTYASDQLTCTDDNVRQLDSRLDALLRQAGATPSADLIESDFMWFRRRSRCAFETEHRNCLIEAYADRISVIEALSTDIVSPKTATCKKLENARRVSIGRARNGYVFIWDSNTKLIGVASDETKAGIWLPALTFTVSGKRYMFKSHDGRRFTCKL